MEIIHNIHNITIWYITEGHGVGIYILLEIIHESHAKDTDFQNKSKWLSKFPIKRKVIRIGSNLHSTPTRVRNLFQLIFRFLKALNSSYDHFITVDSFSGNLKRKCTVNEGLT